MRLDATNRVNEEEWQEVLPVGVYTNAVAKDAIMRAYHAGVLDGDEATDLIVFLGFKSS